MLRSSELPPEFRETKPASAGFAPKPVVYQPPSPEQERQSIQNALQTTHGKVSPAAELLNMSRATFWWKRKLYGL